MFTVWKFKSPSTGEEKLVVHRAYPDDYRYDHYYQKILWRGEARTRQDALNSAATSGSPIFQMENRCP